ncbi:MarR family winged helix-turn-helix transcriptional regulator [Atopobium fossor]|uniref:MarR family winged helix-turn-helix transcriptional regulator n=1 Tax=Atopobium fossor TaxID=39487 RepID=UPI00040E4E17|nr:MarR family transcriptional regulator [Atopobium fossor]
MEKTKHTSITGSSNKLYVRLFNEQANLYEWFARQYGLQSKSLQMLLWMANYPIATGRYVTQSLLAEKTYSTKQVVNATIKNWHKKGWIEFITTEHDKRYKHIRLTPQGLQFAQPIIDSLNTIELQTIASLSTQEQDQLTTLTQTYNAALKQKIRDNYDSLR